MLVAFAADAGRLLVVDDPQLSDVILVLAGETDRRPARALELLDQGYGRRVVIDVPASARIYDSNLVQLAEKYIKGLPERHRSGSVPWKAFDSGGSARRGKMPGRRRGQASLDRDIGVPYPAALSIFREEVPGRSFSVAAAKDETQFGTRWWTHRQWAKTCLDEWMKVVWWTAVERWR